MTPLSSSFRQLVQSCFHFPCRISTQCTHSLMDKVLSDHCSVSCLNQRQSKLVRRLLPDDEGEMKETSAGKKSNKWVTMHIPPLLTRRKQQAYLSQALPFQPWLCHSLLPSCQDLASSALSPPPAVNTTEKPGDASQQVSQGQHHPASSTQAHSEGCLADRVLPWNEAQRTQQPMQGSKAQLPPDFLRLSK